MAEIVPTCQINKKHIFTECVNAPLAGDPEGLCILHSRNKEKNVEAFHEALLARWCQEDLEEHNYQAVFFPNTFDPSIVFGSREFKKRINFSGATFTKRAIFHKVTFKEMADFSHAIFNEMADFSYATFAAGVRFSVATFEKEVFFNRATIWGWMVFRNINSWSSPFKGKFPYLKFQDRGAVRFQDMSLAQVNFYGTDLRHIEFHHVNWHPYRGRQTVYDELLLRQREPALTRRFFNFIRGVSGPDSPSTDAYAEVERLYRNLQVNYEAQNDYKSSGDFHYGELEMHRRASPWRRWFPLSWYNIYLLSSGYGERPLRAVLTLAGLLVVFSLVLLGLEKIPKVSDNWTLAGFWQAFLYVFQQGTLQKPDWLKPATGGGKFLAALMPILIPGQAALFFLALRNRLGRRR